VSAEAAAEAEPCCAIPAGGSPVAGIAAGPRGRRAPEAQTPTGEAQGRKPSGGNPRRGGTSAGRDMKRSLPPRHTNTSRAEHVAAKAAAPARASGWAGGLEPVRGAARAEGAVRNASDPSAQPAPRKDRPSPPSARAGGAPRRTEAPAGPTRGKALTDSRRNGVKDGDALIRDQTPVLRGWGASFPTGTPGRTCRRLDRCVVRRLKLLRWRRHRRRAKPGQRTHFEREDSEARGLCRLRGAARDPKPCTLHREVPPVRRVREACTHGSKGGGGNRTA
jgi:hypothetical protein